MKSSRAIYALAFAVLMTLMVENSSELSLETALSNDFRQFFDTGIPGNVLKNIFQDLDVKNIIGGRVDKHYLTESKISLFCTTCTVAINEALQANSSDAVTSRAIELCFELKLGPQAVCEELVYSNEDVFLYVVKNSPEISGKDICGVIFQGIGCTSDNPDRIWQVNLPNTTKPPVDEPAFPDPATVPTLKVLHLADTHYDPFYLPGSNAHCGDLYFCCRAESGPVQDPTDEAGFWGDYRNCDLPMWTLEALYEHINMTYPDLDFIIWTGDLIPHKIWDTSRQGNLDVIHAMADLLLKYFPGIPVFPSVGNHEADPADLFSQPYVTDPEFAMSWLYDELASVWSNWLPTEAAASVAYAGFYSVLVRPGLRLLSLNSNFCYTTNWWLILDSVDIAQELNQLASELQKAEDAGENVYIIAHHPPGGRDCDQTWSHQYNRIIARYESTVSGIFYGHTHRDHFELFFDPDDPDRVYEIGYIAQSQTTYSYLNPGYKVYVVEGDFNGSKYRVLDHDNWIIELDVANIRNYTEVTHLYSAKADYELQDLSPQSWLDFVNRMNEPNTTLYMEFHANYVKGATPSLACDEKCKDLLLCGLLTSDSSVSYCDKLSR